MPAPPKRDQRRLQGSAQRVTIFRQATYSGVCAAGCTGLGIAICPYTESSNGWGMVTGRCHRRLRKSRGSSFSTVSIVNYRRTAYDYDRRKLAGADTERQLTAFEVVVQSLARHESMALSNPTDRLELSRLGVAVQVAFTMAQRLDAGQLFLSILREFAMAPNERRIIERATKTLTKRQVNRIKPEKAVEAYLKWLAELRLFAETARRVVTEGKVHGGDSEETVVKAGSFRLVDTGGFGAKVMSDVAKVVEKAEKLIRGKGLGKLCYGDVYITNTVYRSTHVLAFYQPHDDNMYVRANLKGKAGPAVHSVVHELGHRLQFRYLKAKKRDIDAIYRRLKDKGEEIRQDVIMDRSHWPKPGDTYVYKGEPFAFEKVDVTNRGDLNAYFRHPEIRGHLKVPLGSYILEKNPGLATKLSAFVSGYASTDPDENFAEMFAFYCQDQLPADQVAMLEPLL